MRPALYAIAIWLSVAVCLAADKSTTIDGPSEINIGATAFLRLPEPSDWVSWKLIPADSGASFMSFQSYLGMSPDNKPIIQHIGIFSTMTPGTYYFSVAASDRVHVVHKIVVKGGPKPDPQPDPQPDPKPDPEPDPFPVPGKRLILLIREPGEANLTVAQVSATLQRYAAEKGHEWRAEYTNLVNKDKQVPSWFKVYTDRIKAKGVPYPALVVGALGDKGVSNVSVIPLPPTPKEAVDFVKSHGG